MFETLAKHVRAASPRSLSHWEQFVAALRLRRDELYQRYQLVPGYESRAVTVLRNILSLVDMAYLTKLDDDYKRYLYHLRFIREDLNTLFDPVSSGLSLRKVFIDKKLFATNEYLVPVDDVDHLAILPLSQPWSAWQQVRPVRLWDHDCPEYSLNISDNRVLFSYQQPSYAIITIDVVSLAFKYFKYLQDETPGEKSDRLFIHKYVLDGLMDDQMDIWLLQQLRLISETASLEDVDGLYSLTTGSSYRNGFVGTRYLEAARSLKRELDKVQQGSINPDALFSTPLLHSGSLLQRIQLLSTELDVSHLRQYRYMRFLMALPLLELLILWHSWQPTTATFRALVRDLQTRLRSLKRERIWAMINDPAVRANVEQYVDQLYTSLDLLAHPKK